VSSCSKADWEQLNTWVSFQSAEQPLLGPFSVNGNTFRKAGLTARSLLRTYFSIASVSK
jgi:hypothetical protein